MKVGLQLYTLRDYIQDEKSIFETFKKVKDIGYDVIQVSGIGLITNEKAMIIKEASEKYNLEIGATHVSFEQLDKDFDLIVETHRLWNCQYVGIGMMPDKYHHTLENYQTFIKKMNELGNRFKERKLTLLYHHHAFEFKKFEDKIGLDILLTGFNKNVQMEIDTFWVQKGGQSPVNWIQKVKGRMDVVHFKDMGIDHWDTQFMECVGYGNLHWDEIISTCLETEVKYAFVEQDDCQGRNPFYCSKMSLEYLKNKHI